MAKRFEAGEGRAAFGVVVGESTARVWGMTSAERLRRTFLRVGVEPRADVNGTATEGRTVVLVRAGFVLDEGLVRSLAGRPGAVLIDEGGRAVAAHLEAGHAEAGARALSMGSHPAKAGAGLETFTAVQLGSAYNDALRKREAPVLAELTPATAVAVEKRLFKGSYKGVTDLVTKYIWPVPARVVTRWCAQVGISPNQVTFASLLLVLAAFVLFWRGEFGWGLVAAWAMTFLDTVDGKLARVTLTSSKIGNVFDHGIDLVHPPFWWWAWLVGVQAGPDPVGQPGLVLAIVVGGYVAQRAEEGVFMRRFKMHMHVWRPFDSAFRLITARRNPNLIVLTLSSLAGRPEVGLLAVAVWTALCFVVHGFRLVQAMAAPRGRVASWLAG